MWSTYKLIHINSHITECYTGCKCRLHSHSEPSRTQVILAPALVGFEPAVASVVALLAAAHMHNRAFNQIQSTAIQSEVKYSPLAEYEYVLSAMLLSYDEGGQLLAGNTAELVSSRLFM